MEDSPDGTGKLRFIVQSVPITLLCYKKAAKQDVGLSHHQGGINFKGDGVKTVFNA